MKAFVVVIVVGAILGAVVFKDELFTIPKKREYITQGLKDPSSAKFRNERLQSNGWLCGEVNAKNSYGAYGGYSRFMSGSADEVYLENEGYAGGATGGTKHKAEITLLALDIQIERLEAMNAIRAAGNKPDMSEISDYEAIDLAVKRHFSNKWREVCQ